MKLIPDIDSFVGDRMNIPVGRGYDVSLIIVDEKFNSLSRDVEFNAILVQAFFTDETQLTIVNCPTVIGMNNELIAIEAFDQSVLGKQISKENLGKWRLHIYE